MDGDLLGKGEGRKGKKLLGWITGVFNQVAAPFEGEVCKTGLMREDYAETVLCPGTLGAIRLTLILFSSRRYIAMDFASASKKNHEY